MMCNLHCGVLFSMVGSTKYCKYMPKPESSGGYVRKFSVCKRIL